MAKPVVAYILIAASLLIFLSTTKLHSGHIQRHGSRRLRLHAAFDPALIQLERQSVQRVAKERGLLNVEAFQARLEEEHGFLEYFFGEEGGLNTTDRLMYLFPLLDQAPMDESVSFVELEVWNRRQAMDRLLYCTERRMKIHDKDGNGEITLSEFLPDVHEGDKDWKNKEYGQPGWWKDLFAQADIDSNGSMNGAEFNDFLHPEDSSNPKVQMWLQREKIREMDQNHDEKLSFGEFRDRTHGIFHDAHDFKGIKDVRPHETKAEEKFAELDVNRDKFLTAQELKPIMSQLHPGELSHAMYYTKYLMHEADDNKDGKLTLKEMLNHHHAFYKAVFEEGPDEDEEHVDVDWSGHDELR